MKTYIIEKKTAGTNWHKIHSDIPNPAEFLEGIHARYYPDAASIQDDLQSQIDQKGYASMCEDFETPFEFIEYRAILA